MKAKIGALVCILLIPLIIARGQSYGLTASHPRVGEPMPHFVLNRVDYFAKTQATPEDFRGKWLFLDFWFPGCVTCIKAFPKVNQLQARFKDEIQFVMVGLNSRLHRHVERVYEGMRKKMDLNLVVAYDSILAETWGIHSMPHIIIVDPQGIVRFITSGSDLTNEKLEGLLKGEDISLKPKDTGVEDDRAGTNVNLRASDSLSLYVSRLTPWTGQDGNAASVDFQIEKGSSFRATKVPLIELYHFAYFGKGIWSIHDSLYTMYYPKPILRVSDSSFFQFDYQKDTGMYDYYLKPLGKISSRLEVMKALQEELHDIFGYNVEMKNVQIPVWKLVAKSNVQSKLSTKGGKYYYYESPSGFIVKNFPATRLLGLIVRYISNKYTIFIDETRLTGNIDLEIDTLMTNWDELRKGLRRNGLDLIPGVRTMKVLAISDPELSQRN